MSGLLSFVLAGAAVVPAAPVAPNEWFNSKDHPKTAMRVVERGHIDYTIDIAPDGSAIRCQTTEQSDLDEEVCELMMKRARFVPAQDDQGRPAFGRHEGVSSFLMPGKNRSRPDRAKLAVTVDRLPGGVPGPAYARVAYLVDAAGAISHCASMPAEGRRMRTVEALGPAACDRIARDYKPAATRDAAGNAVASIQSMMVRFETSPIS